MNNAEIEAILMDHYTGEAQTLTTGAEANLLKFKSLFGKLKDTEATRWEEIKKTFNRNQLFSAAGDDKMALVILQLTRFNEHLEGLQNTIAAATSRPPVEKTAGEINLGQSTLYVLKAPSTDFSPLQQTLLEIAEKLQNAGIHPHKNMNCLRTCKIPCRKTRNNRADAHRQNAGNFYFPAFFISIRHRQIDLNICGSLPFATENQYVSIPIINRVVNEPINGS